MKNGKCPKCGSATVYTKEKGVYIGNGMTVINTGGILLTNDSTVSYLCTNCGYFEIYFTNLDKLAEVTRNKGWKLVPNTTQ